MIIYGNTIVSKIKTELKKKIGKLKNKPGLGIILVGDDKPSLIFVNHKIKFCDEVGINVKFVQIKQSAKDLRTQVEKAIKKFNQAKSIHGIILQLPMPAKLQKVQGEIFELIDPKKDVDCFNPINLGYLNSGGNVILPAVVKACLETLNIFKINLKSKIVLVVGWGQVVGKPLVPALLQKGATVIACNEHTKNLSDLSQKADIIISAVGKPNIISSQMVKRGVVAIDVGSTFVNGHLYGDMDFTSIKRIAKLITPVPGGIGPVTVAMVAKNTLECYLKQISIYS